MYDNPSPDHIPFQNVPEGSSSTGYVDKLILFLEKYLPDFTKERKVDGSQSENDLTQELWAFLMRKRKHNTEKIEHPFDFQGEFSKKKKNQKGHPKRVDLATWLNVEDQDMEIIYCLEAKKLPTPGSGREKEYVFGKGGAIERFKNEVHGLDNAGNLLEKNGIIAYVTDNSFEHWFSLINNWISEYGWTGTEHLSKVYFKTIGKLTSSHTRISGSRLQLIHFWVNI